MKTLRLNFPKPSRIVLFEAALVTGIAAPLVFILLLITERIEAENAALRQAQQQASQEAERAKQLRLQYEALLRQACKLTNVVVPQCNSTAP